MREDLEWSKTINFGLYGFADLFWIPPVILLKLLFNSFLMLFVGVTTSVTVQQKISSRCFYASKTDLYSA